MYVKRILICSKYNLLSRGLFFSCAFSSQLTQLISKGISNIKHFQEVSGSSGGAIPRTLTTGI